MILTCPECSTRFLIKDDAIGPNGRTVRCSQCTATWFVAGDPDVLSLQENIADAAAPAIQAVKPTAVEAGTPDYRDDQDEDFGDGVANAKSQSGAHVAIRDRKEEKKVRRRLGGVLMIWVTTLLLLALMAALAYVFRASIVGQFPASKSIYDAFGIEASATGLEIGIGEVKNAVNEGTEVVIVEGTIRNYDVRPRNVPLVQLSFVNANGEVITSWVVEPHKPILPAGKSLSFVTQYPNRPIDAKDIMYSFVNEAAYSKDVPMVATVRGIR